MTDFGQFWSVHTTSVLLAVTPVIVSTVILSLLLPPSGDVVREQRREKERMGERNVSNELSYCSL